MWELLDVFAAAVKTCLLEGEFDAQSQIWGYVNSKKKITLGILKPLTEK